MSVAEFKTFEELRAHYKAVHARLNRGRPNTKSERLPPQQIINKYYRDTVRKEPWEPYVTPFVLPVVPQEKVTRYDAPVIIKREAPKTKMNTWQAWRDVLKMPYATTWFNPERYAYDDRTRELIREYRRVNPRKSMERVTYEIARQFNVTVEDIMGPRRTLRIAKARQQAIFWSHVSTNRSYANVATYFNRDHTTVIHAMRRVRALPEFETWIAELKMGASHL